MPAEANINPSTLSSVVRHSVFQPDADRQTGPEADGSMFTAGRWHVVHRCLHTHCGEISPADLEIWMAERPHAPPGTATASSWLSDSNDGRCGRSAPLGHGRQIGRGCPMTGIRTSELISAVPADSGRLRKPISWVCRKCVRRTENVIHHDFPLCRSTVAGALPLVKDGFL